MINHYLALVRRELWEHRSIWVTPIAIASVVTLGTLTALVFSGKFAQELDVAIFAAQNLAGDTERRVVLTGFFFVSSQLFLLGLGVLTIFYALDSLYAERKDKSILFWRSLPVTDAETVISKLLTAVVLIPAVAIVGIIGTHLLNLIVTSIWVSMKGGDAGMLIWGSVPFLDNWLAMAIAIFGGAIWMSPFIGWFLFVSAYTKRSPLLMAFLPLVLIHLKLVVQRLVQARHTSLKRSGVVAQRFPCLPIWISKRFSKTVRQRSRKRWSVFLHIWTSASSSRVSIPGWALSYVDC